mmetsp:Transcript_27872/g.65482  ORF Transcript_27872/g.65482 Transcript_27872/m.65482 type:complete len:244 (+) Transcript_27872:243-974(+)|eukprot:CAMPEP_0172393950 /NCGR_PEP_ID=MMETSP1061-20121228/12640_1 /TAXON_ID=37318 /ORGANISM="Pseudo-nitzschia pungens, Strain cf. pungens" /LENGTH=243 /DNA_ID=CAMNT_0013125183 /DNA_START=189 /DNA_END=920 /DNA_ORIENTATION=-
MCGQKCCNSPVTLDGDVDIEACCGKKPEGARCVCLPYNDCLMITAQSISIVALCLSWIWWVTFLLSILAMVVLQILWCCRQNRSGIIVSVAVSGVTGLLCLFSGIYFLVRWRNVSDCYIFTWGTDDYVDYEGVHTDWCPETKWAVVAFVEAALWLTVCGCLWRFVTSGRHAKWEEALGSRCRREDANAVVAAGNVELPAVVAATATAATATATTPTAPAAVAQAVLATDPYLPPEATQKVDHA